MKPRFKTMRDTPRRPTNSAIPRTEGANFLMLNRLATERERILTDESALLARLEQHYKRLAQIESEIDYYKSQTHLFNQPSDSPPKEQSTTSVTPPARVTPTSKRTISDPEPEEPTHWQSLTIEY